MARTDDCETLAELAAEERGIPDGLLSAIARTETGYSKDGQGRRAWPWTLNQGGRSYYFETRGQAEAKLNELLAKGVRNVDVGCMQINYRWHGEQFSSPEAMLDPAINVSYGALFLERLHKQSGSWDTATRHYHSSEVTRGKAYQKRVETALGNIQSAPMPAPKAPETQPIQLASLQQVTKVEDTGVMPLISVPKSATIQGNLILPEGTVPKLVRKSSVARHIPATSAAKKLQQSQWVTRIQRDLNNQNSAVE
ncbi:hypothetical protein PRI8871_01906 [Pseudoprimorskyibacter insulae]|uniref:Transglycosylase SLT domain-containing protein n=2 Tax=Pseudoprimorskyibacter insulae TaxID=1695997 RepID=A0A2R8AW34_9RHOB|nr:hypothetical protein PRI8871_01906 [Pseudoprimorskyibacter insulae]